MLALTRKTNQTIVIDDQIRVTITQIRPGQVRLVIDAPREVPILREELLSDKPTPRAVATAV